MVELTHNPIDTTILLERATTTRGGAVVLFLGTTREVTGDRRTLSLDYECYVEMARRKLAELESEARCLLADSFLRQGLRDRAAEACRLDDLLVADFRNLSRSGL